MASRQIEARWPTRKNRSQPSDHPDTGKGQEARSREGGNGSHRTELVGTRSMWLDLLIFFILVAAFSCYGQQVPATTPPDAINLTGLTTPVEVQFADGRQLSGSGFFYFVFAEEPQKKEGPHWVAIAHIYLVTAKHVIQPKRIKDIRKFTYALRVGDKDQI